jgi:hypothetical protein
MSVASLMDYINHVAEAPFTYAKGRNKRLSNAKVNGLRVTTGGKFPVVRTVCGNRTALTGPVSVINIPLVPEDNFWRPRVLDGLGPIRTLPVSSLDIED